MTDPAINTPPRSAARLSDTEFAAAVEGHPAAAHFWILLADGEFSAAVKAYPANALYSIYACARMTDEQFLAARAKFTWPDGKTPPHVLSRYVRWLLLELALALPAPTHPDLLRQLLSDPGPAQSAPTPEPEKLIEAAHKLPYILALRWPGDTARLSDAEFAAAVEEHPGPALCAQHACDRMTDEQFLAARALCPWAENTCPHVLDRSMRYFVWRAP